MKRSSRAPFALSLALHVAIGALLVQVVLMPNDFAAWLQRSPQSIPVERIGFLSLPQRGPETPGRSGGDNRPERPRTEPSVLQPPAAVAAAAPSLPAVPTPDEGSGPLVGMGGNARGIRPSYSEPRVWVGPADVVMAPRTLSEALGSALRARIRQHEDSLAALGKQRAPGDWAFERRGKKYGMDSTGLHLGALHIPNEVLPRLRTDNVLALDRMRSDVRTRREIEEQSRMRMNEEEFRVAVRNIRERKERERARAEAIAAGTRD